MHRLAIKFMVGAGIAAGVFLLTHTPKPTAAESRKPSAGKASGMARPAGPGGRTTDPEVARNSMPSSPPGRPAARPAARPAEAPGDTVPTPPLEAATEWLRRGDRAQAAAVLEAALSGAASDPELRLQGARFYREQLGDRTRAIAEYEAVYLEDPGNRIAFNELVETLREAGDPKQALDRMTRISERVPGTLEPGLALADLYLETGEPAKAREVLQGIRDSGDPQVHDRLAQAYAMEGDRAAEAAALRRATELVEEAMLRREKQGRDAQAMRRDRNALTLSEVEALAAGGQAEEAMALLRTLEGELEPNVLRSVEERISQTESP